MSAPIFMPRRISGSSLKFIPVTQNSVARDGSEEVEGWVANGLRGLYMEHEKL